MANTSPTITGAVAGGGATLVPAVEWALNAAYPNLHAPDSVAVLIAGTIAVAVHAAVNYLAARGVAVADPLTPGQPGATS